MGRRKIFSNSTVLDQGNSAEQFKKWLDVLRIRDVALICVFFNSYLSGVGAVEAQAQSSNSPSMSQEGSISRSIETVTAPKVSVSDQEEASQSPTKTQTSVSPEVPASGKAASKADFLAVKPSRQAIDLAPLSTRAASQPSPYEYSSQQVLSEQTKEWIVAAETLPLLETTSLMRPVEDLDVEPEPPELRTPLPASRQTIWRIAADPGNPELPPILTCPDPDPELGCIRLQAPDPFASPPPIMYLIPRLDFFRSDNLLLGIDPIDDGLIRPTLTLLAVPPLGPDTYILASIEGAYNRYFKVPVFNYTELRIRAGLLQRLSPTMTAEVGWTNQQLFIANNEIPGFPKGTRFLNDQAIRFELSRRDQITDRLFLNSIYQFRAGFSKPEDRSRILNVLFLSLNWDLNPSRTVQLGLDYQFSAANYTFVRRTDIYQQLLGRITLSAFRNSQLSVYSGISFGDSTEQGIDFNSFVLGVSMSVNIVLF